VLALVAAGVGVALVPDAMRAVAMRDVEYLQVRNGSAPVRYGLGLVWNPANTNPALAGFAGLVRDCAG
jgi:DNA-binding transcriptional LysR family regulator